MKISCVICAWNEEGRIGNVLRAASGCSLISEIIVINDGSTDGTATEVADFPAVKLITLNPNGGKSRASARGIIEANGDYLLFLDADLIGLTAEKINELLTPILSGSADVVLSLRKNSLLIYKMIGLDFVTGERVIPSKLLKEKVAEMEKLPRYGIEVFINEIILKNNCKVKVVKLKDVKQTMKSSKIGFRAGMRAEFKMVREILRTVPLSKIISQNIKLLRRKV